MKRLWRQFLRCWQDSTQLVLVNSSGLGNDASQLLQCGRCSVLPTAGLVDGPLVIVFSLSCQAPQNRLRGSRPSLGPLTVLPPRARLMTSSDRTVLPIPGTTIKFKQSGRKQRSSFGSPHPVPPCDLQIFQVTSLQQRRCRNRPVLVLVREPTSKQRESLVSVGTSARSSGMDTPFP